MIQQLRDFFAKVLEKSLMLILLLVLGFFLIRTNLQQMINQLFHGSHTVQQEFLVKTFEQTSKLIVAEATVDTKAYHSFKNDQLENWPDWTEPLTRLLVGRELSLEIPVRTEFKLILDAVTPADIRIQDQILTFQKPITVEVDSQQDGSITIKKTSNGLVDKAVDVFTSGQKAQEFLNDKSQQVFYDVSADIIAEEKNRQKVLSAAKESLEQVLNLDSKQPLVVDLRLQDLEFRIVD